MPKTKTPQQKAIQILRKQGESVTWRDIREMRLVRIVNHHQVEVSVRVGDSGAAFDVRLICDVALYNPVEI